MGCMCLPHTYGRCMIVYCSETYAAANWMRKAAQKTEECALSNCQRVKPASASLSGIRITDTWTMQRQQLTRDFPRRRTMAPGQTHIEYQYASLYSLLWAWLLRAGHNPLKKQGGRCNWKRHLPIQILFQVELKQMVAQDVRPKCDELFWEILEKRS